MGAKRVTIFLYQWQIDALRAIRLKRWGTKMPMSQAIRNLLREAIEREK